MNETDVSLTESKIRDIIAKDKQHMWHHLTPHKMFESQDPRIFVEGQGVRVRDIAGNEYLDGASGGVWCVNIGYGRASMAKAIHDQLLKLPYFAGTAGTVPAAEFAAKLGELLPNSDHIYFANSGSEANEKAFKIIRQLSRLTESGKYKIIYRDRDYHGTTLGCLAATGQPERKKDYGPFPEGFVEIPHALCYRCSFNKTYPNCEIECAHALETRIIEEGAETVGAVILEPITAGGGVIPPVPEYFPIIKRICEKYDIVLIMDEVVCGFGRTGKMFGFEHFDVVPDIVTMAKGMASSYAAISAAAVSGKIFEKFKSGLDARYGYFRDISTFGGCTAGFAAALENLRIIEEEQLVENSRVIGDYLQDRLKELADYPHIGEVRGKGLLAGVELVVSKSCKTPVSEDVIGAILARIAANGVLVGKTTRSFRHLNNTINIAPPLIITKADVDEIVAAVKIGIEEGCKQMLG